MKALVAIVALLVLPVVSRAADAYPSISHDELVKAIQSKNVTVIDVNGSESYKAGHIPGAIDYYAEKAHLASKLPSDKGALVVAYCGSERCGAYRKAAKAAVDLGYTNVKHYSGGLAGWKAAKGELESK